MSDPESTLRSKIRALRSLFLDQLPGRVAEARRLLAEMGETSDERATEALRRIMHGIKGTGASLGFDELGALALQAETALERARKAAFGEAPAAIADLRRLVDAFERAAKASADPGRAEGLAGFEGPFMTSAAAGERDSPLIYICDDDTLQSRLIGNQLSYFGYRAELFASTSDLRAAALARRPAAVIMDIMFPEGEAEGTTALAELRERGVAVPAIFVSGRKDFEARILAVRAGGVAYFPKPVEPMELLATLDVLTRRSEPEPFRILIVDDEPEVAEYHGLILEEAGMKAKISEDPEKVLDEVQEFRPDLVLMDMYMPRCSGHELAVLIRQIPDHLSLPIIYLSAETDKAKQFTAMSAGADGFLTKPIQPGELISSVALRAERMRELRSLMTRDSLTGLYNHTMTTQMLQNALGNAHRSGVPLSFAMIDLDRFKTVNDTYGHPVGDQVLIAMARVLRQRLRDSDIVGRYGGEEFAVILCGASLAAAAALMDSLREDFRRVIFHAGGASFSCAFSCGIASSGDFPTLESLREAADKTLYKAKNSGRNRVLVAGPRAAEKGD